MNEDHVCEGSVGRGKRTSGEEGGGDVGRDWAIGSLVQRLSSPFRYIFTEGQFVLDKELWYPPFP